MAVGAHHHRLGPTGPSNLHGLSFSFTNVGARAAGSIDGSTRLLFLVGVASPLSTSDSAQTVSRHPRTMC